MTRLARPIERTNGLVGDSIPHLLQAAQGKGGIFLEFKLTLPGGAVLEYKKEPMSWDRFQAICILIGIFIVGSGILQFFELATRR